MNTYNKQNKLPIEKEAVAKYLEELPSYLSNHHVYVYEDYFVMEAIYLFDQMEEMLGEKAGKPYYLPPKEELLKYCDDQYFEESEAYKQFSLKMHQLFPRMHPVRLDEMILEARDLCALNEELSRVLDSLEMLGLSLSNMKVVNQVAQEVTELANHTRLWENNGFTPNELFEIVEKKSLKPLPAQPFIFGQPPAQKKHSKNKNNWT
ncbi:hypothetical protein [Enterococcus sp. LJL98]